MILGGLNSTQIRIRQSTYRYLRSSSILSGLKFLREKDGVELLRTMESVQKEFEADAEDFSGHPVAQVHDYGAVILEKFIEEGYLHPATLRPIIRGENAPVEWVWLHLDGKEYPLGTEDVYTDAEKMKLEIFLRGRVSALVELADCRRIVKQKG